MTTTCTEPTFSLLPVRTEHSWVDVTEEEGGKVGGPLPNKNAEKGGGENAAEAMEIDDTPPSDGGVRGREVGRSEGFLSYYCVFSKTPKRYSSELANSLMQKKRRAFCLISLANALYVSVCRYVVPAQQVIYFLGLPLVDFPRYSSNKQQQQQQRGVFTHIGKERFLLI